MVAVDGVMACHSDFGRLCFQSENHFISKWQMGWMYYKGGEVDDRFYLEREEDIVIVHLTIANEVL